MPPAGLVGSGARRLEVVERAMGFEYVAGEPPSQRERTRADSKDLQVQMVAA
jgi:hypothetical protein